MSEKELREKIARKFCDEWGYSWEPDESDEENNGVAPDGKEADYCKPSQRDFLRAADSILSLLREEGVDLEGWRPIESIEDVPANTPTLFGAYPEGFELFVQAIVQRTPIQFGTYGLRGWDYTNVKATHWRPLPAPPLSALETHNG